MKLTGFFKKNAAITDDQTSKKSGRKASGMELTDEELDVVAGGRMSPSLYAYAYDEINRCGIAQVLKQKAFEELDRMRVSGTEYSPVDVEQMLHKRGVR